MKILTLVLGFISFCYAQNPSGYWDAQRSVFETISLKAGERKLISTHVLPEGTTEIAVRVTLLDDNQKLGTNLASLLKSIPDPTGISQGTAGAVFLLSNIAGKDKCKYALFTDEKSAKNFYVKKEMENVCYQQNTPVAKDARVLTAQSKNCTFSNKKIWLVFESDNWIMNEQITLEIVPWIDIVASSGWTNENKNELISFVQSKPFVNQLENKGLFLGNFINTFTSKYKYSDYQKMLKVEKNLAVEEITSESLKASGQLSSFLEFIREEARLLHYSKRTDVAITKIRTELIEAKLATDKEFGFLGELYLETKQFIKAEESLKRAIEINPIELEYQLKLAHVYMLTDRISQAKEIHKKYQGNSLGNLKTWKEQTEIDFSHFEKNNFDTKNFKKILRVLD